MREREEAWVGDAVLALVRASTDSQGARENGWRDVHPLHLERFSSQYW